MQWNGDCRWLNFQAANTFCIDTGKINFAGSRWWLREELIGPVQLFRRGVTLANFKVFPRGLKAHI